MLTRPRRCCPLLPATELRPARLLGLNKEKLFEIEVTGLAGRPPSLTLHGEAGRAADRLGLERAHVSLSHSGDYAVALVLIE